MNKETLQYQSGQAISTQSFDRNTSSFDRNFHKLFADEDLLDCQCVHIHFLDSSQHGADHSFEIPDTFRQADTFGFHIHTDVYTHS